MPKLGITVSHSLNFSGYDLAKGYWFQDLYPVPAREDLLEELPCINSDIKREDRIIIGCLQFFLRRMQRRRTQVICLLSISFQNNPLRRCLPDSECILEIGICIEIIRETKCLIQLFHVSGPVIQCEGLQRFPL